MLIYTIKTNKIIKLKNEISVIKKEMSEYLKIRKFSGSEIMPTYKAKIFTHIEINYMEEELEILKEAINKINEEISLFNNQTGE